MFPTSSRRPSRTLKLKRVHSDAALLNLVSPASRCKQLNEYVEILKTETIKHRKHPGTLLTRALRNFHLSCNVDMNDEI